MNIKDTSFGTFSMSYGEAGWLGIQVFLTGLTLGGIMFHAGLWWTLALVGMNILAGFAYSHLKRDRIKRSTGGVLSR